MPMQRDLARLKAAYAAWGEQGPNALPSWRELLADDFSISSVDGRTEPAVEFVVEKGARDEALAYLWGIFDQWDMVHYTPDAYVCEGDRIAVFASCAFRNKETGKAAEFRIANLWRFRDGKAVELVEVFDTAPALKAAKP
jgi:ketosteroid isomerase-like protein